MFSNNGMYYYLFIYSIANTLFHLDSPVVRVTGMDIPTPYAYNLEDLSFPKTNNIMDAVKETLHKNWIAEYTIIIKKLYIL